MQPRPIQYDDCCVCGTPTCEWTGAEYLCDACYVGTPRPLEQVSLLFGQRVWVIG